MGPLAVCAGCLQCNGVTMQETGRIDAGGFSSFSSLLVLVQEGKCISYVNCHGRGQLRFPFQRHVT